MPDAVAYSELERNLDSLLLKLDQARSLLLDKTSRLVVDYAERGWWLRFERRL